MSLIQSLVLFSLQCFPCRNTEVKVVHNLLKSEILDVIERSWTENGFVVDNEFGGKPDDLVVFLVKPTSINVCGRERLDNIGNLEGIILFNDFQDPSVLIGHVETIKNYLSGNNVEKQFNDSLIYHLKDGTGIGMKEDNSLHVYQSGQSPCLLVAPENKLNLLFRFANYIPKVNSMVTWSSSANWHGYCHICDEILKSPRKIAKDEVVVIAGFIFQWTPLVYNWLSTLLGQEVKGKKFYLIYNNVTEHDWAVKEWVGKVDFDGLVLDWEFFRGKVLSDIRQHSTAMCTALNCSYLFTVDSNVALLRNNIVSHLVQFNKSVITAPVTQGREQPNFWGDVTEEGWYLRSPDFYDIIDGAWGLFVVPYIKSMYLTRSDALPDYNAYEKYIESDTDVAMCTNYRNKTTLMWLITTLNCAVYTDMTPPDATLPLPDTDLYAAAPNWHSWVDFSLNKEVAFTVTPVEELIGTCDEKSLVLPLFTDDYCKAFMKALSTYTIPPSSKKQIQKVGVIDLRYHLIVEGIIRKSVLPYVQQLINIGGEFEVPHDAMTLFIQESHGETELEVKPDGTERAIHLIWFWSDSEEQGINFMERSCKTHLPSGSILVIESKGETALHLIDSDTKTVGVYAKIIIA